jgi:hypothetical protein
MSASEASAFMPSDLRLKLETRTADTAQRAARVSSF